MQIPPLPVPILLLIIPPLEIKLEGGWGEKNQSFANSKDRGRRNGIREKPPVVNPI